MASCISTAEDGPIGRQKTEGPTGGGPLLLQRERARVVLGKLKLRRQRRRVGAAEPVAARRRALRDRPHGLREAHRAVDARPVTPASVWQMVAKMHFA